MRRVVSLLAFTGLLIAIAFAAMPSPRVTGQDNTEDRVSALETTVADIGTRVADIEANAKPTEKSESGASSGDISLKGTGQDSTDSISLSGAYKVAATCASGYMFTVDVTPISNPDDFVIIRLLGVPPYEGSEVSEFPEGTYAFSITCEGDWTLRFTKLG